MTLQPFVTVLVPTYNRSHLLERGLASLLSQSYPADRYEVVVVSDGSTDDTDAIVRSRIARRSKVEPDLVYVPIAHGGLNTARNAGLAAARGDLICLVDDDVVAPPAWLAALASGYLTYPDAGAFGGPIRLSLERPMPRSCGREELGETVLDAGPEVCEPEVLYGSNLAVTRAAVTLIGPFDVTLPSSGDEEEWLRRLRAAGRRILYLPDAEVLHRRTEDDLRLRNLMRKRYARGRDQVSFDRLVGNAPSVRAEVRQVLGSLAHSLRSWCALGLLPAAGASGRLVGIWRTRRWARLARGLAGFTVAMLVWQVVTAERIARAGGCGYDGEQYCAAARGLRIDVPYARRPLVPWLVRALHAGSVLDRFVVVDLVALLVAAVLAGVLVIRLAGSVDGAVVAGCLVLLQPLTVHAALTYPAATDPAALALGLAWLVLFLSGRPWWSVPVVVLACLAREAWGPVALAVVAVDFVVVARERWRLHVATFVAVVATVAFDYAQPSTGPGPSTLHVVRTWLTEHFGSPGGFARLVWMLLTGLGLVPLLLLSRKAWRLPRGPVVVLAVAAFANAVLAVIGGNDTARLLLPTMAVGIVLAVSGAARSPGLVPALAVLVIGTIAVWRPWLVSPPETTAFLRYYTPYYSGAAAFTRRFVIDGMVALTATVACVAMVARSRGSAGSRAAR